VRNPRESRLGHLAQPIARSLARKQDFAVTWQRFV
jgi:hypothetical protein